MSKRDDELIQRHTPHGWVTSMSMATIQRVPRAATEQIMECPCGFYGWVSRAALLASDGGES